MVVVSKVVELYSLFVVVKGLAHVVSGFWDVNSEVRVSWGDSIVGGEESIFFILIGICSCCLAKFPLGFCCGLSIDEGLEIPSMAM